MSPHQSPIDTSVQYFDSPFEDVLERCDAYAKAIANVTVYTRGRTDITGDEIADLLAGVIPERLRRPS